MRRPEIPFVTEAAMARSPLTPEQEAQAQQLVQQLQQATADDLLRLARTLVAQDQRHLFGQTEVQVRDLALRIGAKAYDALLAQKKTATSAPG
jgi:parvulin-like peptidyl-prolyl isomerase